MRQYVYIAFRIIFGLSVYVRTIRGGTLNTQDAQFCLDAAERALQLGIPGIINVDQGVQFTSADFIGLWNPESTKISMDHKGRCFDNIFTERFWRTLKYEEVYLGTFEN